METATKCTTRIGTLHDGLVSKHGHKGPIIACGGQRSDGLLLMLLYMCVWGA